MESSNLNFKPLQVFHNISTGLTQFRHQSKSLQLLLDSVGIPINLLRNLTEEFKVLETEFQSDIPKVDIEDLKQHIEDQTDSRIVKLKPA